MHPPRPGPFPQVRLLLAWALCYLAATVAGYIELSDGFLKILPSPRDDDFDIHSGKMLAPILIPRVPGTPGQAKVQEHLVSWFQRELPKWTMEWQNSTSTTPATGNRQIPFGNIIFKREPPWTAPGHANLLTLVAHYDSKMKPDGFIGATDSAAPVAMLLHVAKTIDKYLTQMYDEMIALGESGGMPATDMGVQILLLDGEEAFVSWSDTDSLYGARALAAEWESTPAPALSPFKNRMRQVRLFVLLDLLGSSNPSVPSYFQQTHWAYRKMANVEKRLRDLGVLESKPSRPFLFQPDKKPSEFGRAFVEDDHIPFMKRGAPVLHMIPTPFPGVWHTAQDDGEHLDMKTVRDWARIVTAFTMEWLAMMEVEPKDLARPAPVTGTEGGAAAEV